MPEVVVVDDELPQLAARHVAIATRPIAKTRLAVIVPRVSRWLKRCPTHPTLIQPLSKAASEEASTAGSLFQMVNRTVRVIPAASRPPRPGVRLRGTPMPPQHTLILL